MLAPKLQFSCPFFRVLGLQVCVPLCLPQEIFWYRWNPSVQGMETLQPKPRHIGRRQIMAWGLCRSSFEIQWKYMSIAKRTDYNLWEKYLFLFCFETGTLAKVGLKLRSFRFSLQTEPAPTVSLHHHTQFMECWGGVLSFRHARQAAY